MTWRLSDLKQDSNEPKQANQKCAPARILVSALFEPGSPGMVLAMPETEAMCERWRVRLYEAEGARSRPAATGAVERPGKILTTRCTDVVTLAGEDGYEAEV